MRSFLIAAVIALGMAAAVAAQARPFDPRDYQHRHIDAEQVLRWSPHFDCAL